MDLATTVLEGKEARRSPVRGLAELRPAGELGAGEPTRAQRSGTTVAASNLRTVAQFRAVAVPLALGQMAKYERYPGTIIVEFLDLIPPGLSRDEFLARASEVIETATAKLIAEGRQERARLIGNLAPLDEPVAGN